MAAPFFYKIIMAVTSNTDFFLILGDARSGTTFLANEISARLPVAIPPESNIMSRVLCEFDKNRQQNHDYCCG